MFISTGTWNLWLFDCLRMRMETFIRWDGRYCLYSARFTALRFLYFPQALSFNFKVATLSESMNPMVKLGQFFYGLVGLERVHETSLDFTTEARRTQRLD
jgi:hypothetical protein